MTKLISWNVNGFRAVMKKISPLYLKTWTPIFSAYKKPVTEGANILSPWLPSVLNYAERKGYSGTAIWSRAEPLSVTYDIPWEPPDLEDDGTINREGRVITLEFSNYYLVNVYTPNSQSELARLDLRMAWKTNLEPI